MPSNVVVCPIHLPGRGLRITEPPFLQIEPLVDALCGELTSLIDRRFAFFGHSMGGLIAFELARKLKECHGISPAHLFVSAHCSPGLEKDRLDPDLPDPEFIEMLRKLNGTPPEVLKNAELMQLLMPRLRADLRLCKSYTYKPGPPLDCPISAYAGLEDLGVPQSCMEGWKEQTRARFNSRLFRGTHFFLNESQPALLKAIATDLALYRRV